MALRLTLISHAGTLAQKQGRFPLDESVEIDWRSKANTLGQLFSRRARFLHGPEQRAIQTAALFSQHCELTVGLRDCDFGLWKGLRIEDIDHAALCVWMSDWQVAPHGGESIRQVLQRVSEWMDSLTGIGHIIAITHPFVIRAALIRVLQCPPVVFHAVDVEPLSAVDLRFNGIWRMRAISLLDWPQDMRMNDSFLAGVTPV